MSQTDRRTFLKMIGAPAVAAGLPTNLGRALEIPAHHRTGTIADVEHIIFLMQENRSFDHYLGAMKGVRGFADPHPVKLASGQSVWHQPNGSGYLLPFRPEVEDLGTTFLPDPPHGWNDGHAAWNQGHYDQWVPNKGVQTMTYHTRKDLAYPYALADAFTICDNYFCSLMGPTDPNRYHMWSGWVGNDGNGGGPVVDNAEAGYDWSTYPERLERAGISWKIYQDIGIGLNAQGGWGWTSDPFIGNYGDNSLLYFHQYQFALPGNPLADRAKVGTNILTQNREPDRLMDMFRDDVQRGRLPQVSWIVAPEAYTEHPNWEPDFGSWYVSQVIDILAANPEIWSKMVLFITYDEEGGFFDHLVPPTPPQTREHGLSTVAITNEIFPGSANYSSAPYGLGIRVPTIVVSPWSKGGWVNSQVFDHTSLIRFLEARFAGRRPDLIETNITPWRRAVVGDLTSAFDFKTPNSSKKIHLPSTDDSKPENLVRQPDEVPVPPADQMLPSQERGVRPARALPYELHATGLVETDGSFRIDFWNTGEAAAVFHVRSGDGTVLPRSYTVEPHKKLSDTWNTAGDYDLSVHGPNGFFRAFKGGVVGQDRAKLEIRATYAADEEEGGKDEQPGSSITLRISNETRRRVQISILNKYTHRSTSERLGPGESTSKQWSLKNTWGWYDFVITTAADPSFEYQLAGHVENGKDSISDPAMGGLV